MAESPPPEFDHKTYLNNLTSKPGVYQMFDNQGEHLYVGKAKNLKKRLASYFRKTGLNAKTQALVARIGKITVTITNTETEALILEHNLIKSNRPPFNILLRDDKSYPYIYLSNHTFPRLSLHRGTKRGKGVYFGPYPHASAARESLAFLQKVFLVRQCEDSFYKNRSRPCLQHQIKRCTAPCVDLVSKEEYAQQVKNSTIFLQGKSQDLLEQLAVKMEQAAEQLAFEEAAQLRDQIHQLQQVQATQHIDGVSGDLDIIASAFRSGSSCIQMLYVRSGRILGSRNFYPKYSLADSAEQVLAGFLGQHYLSNVPATEIPKEIVVSHKVAELAVLREAIQQRAGRKTSMATEVRSNRAQWLKLAINTAEQNLTARLASHDTLRLRFEKLQDCLGLDEMPERLECYDISHTQGEATVASCVVFDANGPLKSDYRRFNIEGVTPGDDYAAMAQALRRRYLRLKKGEGRIPDILFIDGGKGQVHQAQEVLEELQVEGVLLLGVSKGRDRKAGQEVLYDAQTKKSFVLASDSPALHLIQHIRDESHRFAIAGHRAKRQKTRKTSTLEDIAGVGAKRRRELLRHFGGIQGVKAAAVDDIAKVPGISQKLAQDIYAAFRHH